MYAAPKWLEEFVNSNNKNNHKNKITFQMTHYTSRTGCLVGVFTATAG